MLGCSRVAGHQRFGDERRLHFLRGAIFEMFGNNLFDRDIAPQCGLAGKKNLPHSAFPDYLVNGVLAPTRHTLLNRAERRAHRLGRLGSRWSVSPPGFIVGTSAGDGF